MKEIAMSAYTICTLHLDEADVHGAEIRIVLSEYDYQPEGKIRKNETITFFTSVGSLNQLIEVLSEIAQKIPT